MIFSEKFLFLHYPKTGGMMLTPQLLRSLRGKVHYSLPNGHVSPQENLLCIKHGVTVLSGLRHENIAQAKEKLNSSSEYTKFEDFQKVLVIIRNPYDYIVSRFHYLMNNQNVNKGPAARIAAEGDFRKYVLEAPRFFKVDGYLLDENGKIPNNLFIVRFEDFSTQINPIASQFLRKPLEFETRINTSNREKYMSYFTDSEIEEAVYKKFLLLFNKGFYSRITF